MIWASVIQAGWSHTHTHTQSQQQVSWFVLLPHFHRSTVTGCGPARFCCHSFIHTCFFLFFFTQMFFHYGSAEWTHTQIKSTVLEDEVGLLRIKTVTWQQSQSRGHDWGVTTVTVTWTWLTCDNSHRRHGTDGWTTYHQEILLDFSFSTSSDWPTTKKHW